MTQKQKFYKMALIKQVHTSKLYVEIYSKDRELYEQMLHSSFGVKSSKNLDIDSLKKLVLFLGGRVEVNLRTTATKNQIAFIRTLWRQRARNKDEKALLKMIYNRFKLDLNSIDELERKDFKKVVAVLNKIKPETMQIVDYSCDEGMLRALKIMESRCTVQSV